MPDFRPEFDDACSIISFIPSFVGVTRVAFQPPSLADSAGLVRPPTLADRSSSTAGEPMERSTSEEPTVASFALATSIAAADTVGDRGDGDGDPISDAFLGRGIRGAAKLPVFEGVVTGTDGRVLSTRRKNGFSSSSSCTDEPNMPVYFACIVSVSTFACRSQSMRAASSGCLSSSKASARPLLANGSALSWFPLTTSSRSCRRSSSSSSSSL